MHTITLTMTQARSLAIARQILTLSDESVGPRLRGVVAGWLLEDSAPSSQQLLHAVNLQESASPIVVMTLDVLLQSAIAREGTTYAAVVVRAREQQSLRSAAAVGT